MNKPSHPDLTITPRDRRFGRETGVSRLWHGGRVEATAMYNALSTIFPSGEAFFVDTLRLFRNGAPPKLAAQIAGFITQETIHSREHQALNGRAARSGYDLSQLEALARKRVAANSPPVVKLAATMALEHFTAMFAHELLSQPRHLKGAEKETADLWRWHAAEEIEHKAVAYDAWLHVTRASPRFKRWKFKSRIMLKITRVFIADRTWGGLQLMRQDGVTGIRAKARLLWYMWGWPGMFRRIAIPWLRYFLPGFHPWNIDDSDLIAGFDAASGTAAEYLPQRTVRRSA